MDSFRSRPRIALLDASFTPESTRRNFRREVAAELVEFPVSESSFPKTFEFDGVIVTGSAASVYWEEDWIEALIDWLRDAIDHNIPMLGVCFGHQALAAALGGRVTGMGEYELGYRTVRHRENSWLFDGIGTPFQAFTTHQDTVTTLPEGATVTAENDYGIHGFEKDRVFTVQFHPEYDMETAVMIIEEKDLPDTEIQSALETVTTENYVAACEAKQVFDNFVSIVQDVNVHGQIPHQSST